MKAPIRLPRWLQRTNPLVQRHMNPAARADRINIPRLVRLFLLDALAVAGSVLLLSLEGPELTSPAVTLLLLPAAALPYALLFAAAFFLPVILILYGITLVRIVWQTADFTLIERRESTLDLLRTTPFSLRDIHLSQIAAACWNRAGLLDTLFWLAALLALPPVVLLYATIWFPSGHPLLVRLGMIAAIAASIIRPFLEIMMAGAVGILTSTMARYSLSAKVSGALLLGAYFALVNLPRLLILPGPLRLAVELVLPLGLPVLVTWAALEAADRITRRD